MFINYLPLPKAWLLVPLFFITLLSLGYAQQPPPANQLDEWEAVSHGTLFDRPASMHCRIGREKGAQEVIVSSSDRTWTSHGMTWFSGAITAQVGDYDLYFNGRSAPYSGYLVNLKNKNNPLPALIYLMTDANGAVDIIIEKKLTLKTEIWGRFKVVWKKI